MSNSTKRLIVLFLFLIAPVCAVWGDDVSTSKQPYPTHFYIKQIDATQGLSNPSITAIHTDSSGSVWIGTKYLLNKYTNGVLVSYDANKTVGSYITLLFEDDKNRMWIGTESTLSRYDSSLDEFTDICNVRANCALEYKGKYYFAGKGDIIVIDSEDGSISRIETMTTQIISSFVVRDDILLFVDSSKGMYFYNVESGSLARFPVPEIEGSTITSSLFDDSAIYLGVLFKGVYKIDLKGNILEKYAVDDYPDLRIEVVSDIKRVGSQIWLATNGSGICVFKNGRIVPISQLNGNIVPFEEMPHYKEISRIPSNTTCIHEDRYSNIWIGSAREGVSGIKATRIFGSNVYVDFNRKDGRNSAILSIAKAEDGLWVGTENGLFKYYTRIHSFVPEENCKQDIVNSIADLGNNELLISSYCKGLFKYNTKTKVKNPFVIQDQVVNKKEITSGNNINLTKLSNEEVLILGENIYRHNFKTGKTVCLASDLSVSSAGLRAFYVAGDLSLAYAFSPKSLFKLDLIENKVTLLHTPDICEEINTAEYLPGDGNIYFGTDSWLHKYDMASKSISKAYQGLFSRVSHICSKGNYALWAVSGNALYSIDIESHIIHIYDESDGFYTNGVQVSELYDGFYYFGGLDNLSAVPANLSSSNDNKPSISLSRVFVDGQIIPVENGKIKIRHNHNTIDINFSSKDSDPFSKTLFKYSISGPESGKVETYDNLFSLSRLSYGKYTVSTSYHTSDGFWSNPVQCLSIRVSKPFWQRGWVSAVLALLIALAAAFIIFINSKKTEETIQSAILQNSTKEREKRVHFINSIEAEMASPLSQISKESKALLEDGDASLDKQRERIEKIYSKSTYIEKMINVAIKQERPEQQDNPFINKFNQIIDERISDASLDVPVLVHEMAMSRTALYDKVKELTGMGINEYIQSRRLVKARKLLIDTDMSIAEISDELGFSSSKYFSEIFKKAFEVSPREFKKKIMGVQSSGYPKEDSSTEPDTLA